MHNRNTMLVLKDLPSRAEELSPSEIQNVFGGCSGAAQVCDKNHDCCDGFVCSTSHDCVVDSPYL